VVPLALQAQQDQQERQEPLALQGRKDRKDPRGLKDRLEARL
jgi:hypothetical protein